MISPMSMLDLTDRIAEIPELRSRDEVWEQACRTLEDAGFDGVFYADLGPHGGTMLRSARITWGGDTLMPEDRDRDPLFRHACRSTEAAMTGPDFLHLHQGLDVAERDFIHAAAGSGFTAGLALPFRPLGRDGVGVWHLLSSAGGAHVAATAAGAEQVLRQFCATVRGALDRREGAGPRVLSPRERECLIWLARGLRTDAIADRLGVSMPTVHFHVLNARAKLGAATREEAVASALIRGEIGL